LRRPGAGAAPPTRPGRAGAGGGTAGVSVRRRRGRAPGSALAGDIGAAAGSASGAALPRVSWYHEAVTFDDAKALLAALEREGVEYAVVGSLAMAAHGLVRATRDLDLFVSPDAANVDRLKAALRSVFADPEIEKISAEDLAGAYPAVQYVPPSGDFSIDILARLGEAWRYGDIEWQRVAVADLLVRVATPRMLYRMKRDTVRPQDRMDAAALQQRFDLPED
jgi:hypothetical protein